MKEKVKEKRESAKAEERSKRLVVTRGRIFEGFVTRKFPNRIAIEFERTIYIPKYERYLKKKTRIHARLPENINVNMGDLVRVQECRPLSKLIHFLVIKKLASTDSKGSKK